MFRLIGMISKKIYYEDKRASDVNKWRIDNFVEDHHRKGGAGSEYVAPEAMRIVEIKPLKPRKEYLEELLDDGKYEEYRKAFDKYDRDVEVYGGGRKIPGIINRRKKVEKLFREGASISKISTSTHMTGTTIKTDLKILRKTFPELRKRRARK